MRGKVRSPEKLRLLGGSLPLDFVNSVDWRTTDRPVEYLGDYDALLSWSMRLETISPAGAAVLRAEAAREPAAASDAAARLRLRREELYALLAGLTSGRRPDARQLDGARRWYRSAIDAGALHDRGKTIALSWPDDDRRLDRPGWPIAQAAWDLLADPLLERMKMCPAVGCGWLFIDQSKNRTRRWCSMDGCGARMKMRRSYARTRKARPAQA